MSQELPAQVQRDLDEAEAIEKAIAEEQAALQQEKENTAPPEVTPEPVADAAPPEQKPIAQPDADDSWKTKFDVLQGKFNAEVPRLAQQLRAANESIEALRKQNELLAQAPAPATEAAQTVTSEDEEAFGSDLIAVMKKVAKQEADAVARAQQAEVQKVTSKIESVEQVQAATAGDRFMSEIAKAVPDWEVVNADPKWLDWLGEYSPETGAPRQVALDTASNALDVSRTVALFNAFKATQAPATTNTSQQKAQQELQSQVAPAKTVASVTPVNNERIWSGDDYEKAYDIRNSQTMSQSEVEALQAEAERAYNEGRVRW